MKTCAGFRFPLPAFEIVESIFAPKSQIWVERSTARAWIFMAEKWELKGNWTNSGSCDQGCPCLFDSDPTKGSCDAVDTLRLTEGNYGKVKLGGTSIVVMAKATGQLLEIGLQRSTSTISQTQPSEWLFKPSHLERQVDPWLYWLH